MGNLWEGEKERETEGRCWDVEGGIFMEGGWMGVEYTPAVAVDWYRNSLDEEEGWRGEKVRR